MIAQFIAHGADISICNDDGESALMLAIQKPDVSFAKLYNLIEKSTINSVDENGDNGKGRVVGRNRKVSNCRSPCYQR